MIWRRTKDWTLLVYVVGDHKAKAGDLDDAIAAELKAICDAADFSRVSVVVQADFQRKGKTVRATLREAPPRPSRPQDERPQDNPLSRLVSDQLKPPKHPLVSFGQRVFQSVASTLKNLFLRLIQTPDVNAASKKVLEDFLRYGRKQCPARRYLIYFFGHAFGPMGLFYDSETRTRSPNALRLNDLADAIETGKGHAAIVLFRDCFMSTLETAFQLQHCADFMIASQAEAPIAGVWPWNRFLASLGPSRPSFDIGKELAVTLTDFLKQDGNRGPFADVPYALLDLAVAPRLVAPLKALVRELDAARANPERRKACAKVLEAARIGVPDDPKSPGDPALIDVATICTNLQKLSSDPMAQAARQLEAELRSLVPFSFTLLGLQKGVALYYGPFTREDRKKSFIESADLDEAEEDKRQYQKLALCKESTWGRFAVHPLSPS